MYSTLARGVLLDEDPERAVREVRKLQERHPRLSRGEVAEKLIQRAAVRSAAIGALASAPAGWMAGLPAAADFSYQVLAMNRLTQAISVALRRRSSAAERALAAVASLALAGTAEWLRGRSVAAARRALSRRAPRLSPVAGALIGATLSSLAAVALGKAALDYCRSTPAPRSPRR